MCSTSADIDQFILSTSILDSGHAQFPISALTRKETQLFLADGGHVRPECRLAYPATIVDSRDAENLLEREEEKHQMLI